MSTANPQRPVQLQVYTAKAWKTVMHFDAGDVAAATKVQLSVSALHEVDTSTNWRITTIGRSPAVLGGLSKSTYGLWTFPKGAL